MAIPVTLVPNGAPVTATNGAVPVTLVDAKGVPEPLVPPDGVVVTQGETVDVLSSDGSTQLAQGTADVDTSPHPNTLNGIDLAANLTVLAEGASIPVQESDGTAIGNGTLHVAANQPTHFTYDGGGSGTALANGDAVNIDTADGNTILATGTASVVDGNLVGVLAPGSAAVLTDGQASVNINQYDNSASFAASVAVAGNNPTFTLANATTRIAVNGQSVTVSGGGQSTPATVAIDQGAWQDFTLGDATAAIVNDAQSIALQDSGGGALDAGTASIAANVLTVTVPDSVTNPGGGGPSAGDNVGVWNAANSSRMFVGTANYDTGPLKVLAPGTVADLHDSGEVSLQNSAGDARGTLDVSVSGNVGILKLKAQEDTVTDGDHVMLRYSNGDDTGETLAVKVPAASLDSVQIDQAFTIVSALQWVNVSNSPGDLSYQALASLTADGRLDKVTLGDGVSLTPNNSMANVSNMSSTVVCEAVTQVVNGRFEGMKLTDPTVAMIADSTNQTITVDGVQKVVTYSVSGGLLTGITTADP